MTRASDTAKLLGAGATILDGTTISTADNTDQLTLISTDADANAGPNLKMSRQSASAADGDVLGKIDFIGHNDAGTPEDISYGDITGTIIDASDGTEDGMLVISTMQAGSSVSRIRLQRSETVFNEDSTDTDFRVESDNATHALFVEGSSGNIGIGDSDPTRMLHIKALGTGVAEEATIMFENEVGTTGSIGQGDTNSNAMIFTENGSERMRLDTSGNLLVGTTSADSSGQGARLKAGGRGDFTVSGGACSILNRTSSDGTILNLQQASNSEGSISVSGSTVSYNAFSGSHWSRLTDNSKPTILKGTIIETTDEMCDWYQAEITIPKTDDKDEYKIKESIALPSGKKVGDTISHTYEGVTYDNVVIIKEADNKHTKCKISDTADSKRVYGVHADWDNDDDTVNDMYVTAVGTHVVRINKDVTVSAGDLLSSNGDGTAKVQDDDIIRSKTIGKVLTNIKQETYSDGSYTVPCALYCG